MPRTRTAQAAPIEEMEEEEAQGTEVDLRFSEPLSWPAGKAIPTTELLKRLETLATELKEAEQETISRGSLTDPAQELAHSNLIRHKDKGIRSWTAHCLVDILRLAAPDAPFSAGQLKEIFNLFVTHSIPHLSDSSDAYSNQHYHVLHCLLSTKAVVLITDIPSSRTLLTTLFAKVFDILSQPSEQLSKNVEFQLSGLLQCLIEECDDLPKDAVEIMLAQFMRAHPKSFSKFGKSNPDIELAADQTTLDQRQLPSAYHVAQSVCNTCADRMARYVGQYFGEIIVGASGYSSTGSKAKSKHGKRHELEDEDEHQAEGPTKDDLDQLDRAHRLLRELWKACPGILQNVVPQIETELSAEKLEIRRVATAAFADMVAGIGAEAELAKPVLDPTIYTPHTSEASSQGREATTGDLRAAKASLSFAHTHPIAYQSLMSRRNDKAPEVRAAWTIGIARVLSTSAGGLGVSLAEQSEIVSYLSEMLIDSEDKVRQAAVQALEYLDVDDWMSKVGAVQQRSGSSVLMDRLSERIKEVNPIVRSEAAQLLGKLWGVSAHHIQAGDHVAINLFGAIPTNILNATYANRRDINALIDQVLFESLIPLGYPSLRKRKKDQKSQANGHVNGNVHGSSEQDTDRIRAERILLLFAGLDDKAKKPMLALMGRPLLTATIMKQFFTCCETFNGGVMDSNEKETRIRLGKFIKSISEWFSNPGQASEDLWKFAKDNHTRTYVLIRYCMEVQSDYKRVQRSIRELTGKLEERYGTSSTFYSTIKSLVYRVSNLFYNKSHVHPMISLSSQQGSPLAQAAHDLLKDISSRAPEVFRAHGKELCQLVETEAPSVNRTNDQGALDNLKTCATFARQYPHEVPQEKTFRQAMMRYVQKGSTPSAAKYATRIALWSSNKKEMFSKELLKHCLDDFQFGKDNYVSKLAALSQLMLYNAKNMDTDTEIDPILDLAIKKVIMRPASSEYADTPDEPAAQQEQDAKCWALKILVNRLRAYADAELIKVPAVAVYRLLRNLLLQQPAHDASKHELAMHNRIQLQAALLHLKLATQFDRLLSPQDFNDLVIFAQNPSQHIRESFVTKVTKYLGQEKLFSRFYTTLFLLAFEPIKELKHNTIVWLRARATHLHAIKKDSIEQCFSRFLSVLAHHPDFTDDINDIQDLVTYILFYLTSVSTADNISLIYHVAQRVKTVRDGITASSTNTTASPFERPSSTGSDAAEAETPKQRKSKHLYYLSDLSLTVITAYASIHNWNMQTYSGKVSMPSGVFANLSRAAEDQKIADTAYLSAEAAESVEGIVRSLVRKGRSEKNAARKRKSDGGLEGHVSKKVNGGGVGSGPVERVNAGTGSTRSNSAGGKLKSAGKNKAKTPAKRAARRDGGSDGESGAEPTPESSVRRQSSRARGRKSYVEAGEEDDDQEMEVWQEPEETSFSSKGSEKENRSRSDVAA